MKRLLLTTTLFTAGCIILTNAFEQVCGDGFVQSPEECDDANQDALDGCDQCVIVQPIETCGDGVNQPGELCLDGANFELQDQDNVPGGLFIATGDFNGDSSDDLVIGESQSIKTQIFLNDGQGAFTNTNNALLSVANDQQIVAVDLNGDDFDDIVLTDQTEDQLSIFTNDADGDGSFTFSVDVKTPLNSKPFSTVAVDLNSDSNIDLATVCTSPVQLSFFLSNGGTLPTTSTNTIITGITSPGLMVSGNFDGDNDLDLVVANQNEVNLAFMRNNGDNTFTQQPITAAIKSLGIAAADFNGDNVLDLAITSPNENKVQLLLNNGSAIFTGNPPIDVGARPGQLVAVDMNADAKLDLVFPSTVNNELQILLAQGDDTFELASISTGLSGAQPIFLVTSDFNQDSLPDVAVSNLVSDTVSLFLSNP